jgi:hypothetical protein
VSKFIGLAFGPNSLYGLTSSYEANPSWKGRLFTASPNNSFSFLGIGSALSLNGFPLQCYEGDLAYDKSLNKMYGTCDDGGGWFLMTIKLSNGVVTDKGSLPAATGPYGYPYYSALAFNPAGELFALDTYNKKLYKLDKNNASVIQPVINLSGPVPIPSAYGGMGFSDLGELYVSFGGQLAAINILTGDVTVVGNGAYSGLIVSGGGVITKRAF